MKDFNYFVLYGNFGDYWINTLISGINREQALGRPILYSNWLSKDYVPVLRDQLREYVKARLKVRTGKKFQTKQNSYRQLHSECIQFHRESSWACYLLTMKRTSRKLSNLSHMYDVLSIWSHWFGNIAFPYTCPLVWNTQYYKSEFGFL